MSIAYCQKCALAVDTDYDTDTLDEHEVCIECKEDEIEG
jgi:hypothetical protein